MNPEAFESKPETENRIPTKERTKLQLTLMRIMLHESLENLDRDSRPDVENWMNTYTEKVSDIIDDPQNEQLRHFIMQEKYEEAAPLVIELLEQDSD